MTEQTLDRPIVELEPGELSGSSDIESPSAETSKDMGSLSAHDPQLKVSWGSSSDVDDFDYVPVSPWAPISLGLGLLGLTGFLGIFGLYVAFFGIFVGAAAVIKIRGAAGEVKGTMLAATGLVLSIGCFVLGSAKMAHAYSTEVPEGFLRVNFPRDIAEKQFVYIDGRRKLHPAVAELMEKKVYLKGFMWATTDTQGLTQFVLLKDNGECCFGGKPKSHDFILVKLPTFPAGQQPPLSFRSGGMTAVPLTEEEKQKLQLPHDTQLTTEAYLGMVAVAGVLHADVTAGETGSRDDYELATVYTMDADLVEEAWTRF